MCENEIRRYQALNELADQGGLVIMGGSSDREIPLCELKQDFAIDEKLYNRSITGFSVRDAAEYYDKCIKAIAPDSIFLHIGEADISFFAEDPSGFDREYRELIGHIRNSDKKCDIAVISIRNPEEDAVTSEMNKHLKYIADSERCEYADITTKRVWNPSETKDIVSFVYSTGFVYPLKNKRPLYDLVKILFCYEA